MKTNLDPEIQRKRRTEQTKKEEFEVLELRNIKRLVRIFGKAKKG